MIDPKKIEQLARQVHDAIPKGIRDFGDDMEKKIRQILTNQLSKLQLVNREEFDVQTQVLQRTREKLTALEARIATLESRSGNDSSRVNNNKDSAVNDDSSDTTNDKDKKTHKHK